MKKTKPMPSPAPVAEPPEVIPMPAPLSSANEFLIPIAVRAMREELRNIERDRASGSVVIELTVTDGTASRMVQTRTLKRFRS